MSRWGLNPHSGSWQIPHPDSRLKPHPHPPAVPKVQELCPLTEQESLDLWLLPPVLCLSLFLMFLEHIFPHVLGTVGWSGRQLLSSYDHCIHDKGAAISLAQQQSWEGPEDTGPEQVPSPDQEAIMLRVRCSCPGLVSLGWECRFVGMRAPSWVFPKCLPDGRVSKPKKDKDPGLAPL